jgi:hypothetical protein
MAYEILLSRFKIQEEIEKITKQVFEDKPSDGKSFTWKLQPV